jgi:heme-degrading monooxygenase HmoA
VSPTELAGGDYYAVIFTSELLTPTDPAYDEAAGWMLELATEAPGFLGVDTARAPDGLGLTVSYWRSEADIARWREHTEHAATRQRGRAQWYQRFTLRVARIEREYAWDRDR